ncbi:phosphotransferase enzyme family protein [Actinomadura mexicana]|uniref:Ser/Thr protein kinase RdoA involved in Cpx stress response, MazF antagonist n=1 Tax=Actinomadura mexicana TaxID=134959 RepID=A0A239GF28_9ACTN|nr:phosphotransferase [Actinomadura mexicana]SNS67906.1 Ser/Thr protein kinase RdoA involved in Cpx stress response, MazF antagonist [Actinomadura mexicana]
MPTSESADARDRAVTEHRAGAAERAGEGGQAKADDGPGAEPLPPRLLKRWEIGAPDAATPLATGPGHRSWRVDSAGGAFFLREHAAADRRRALFQHGVTAALDAAGLPVLAPVPARGGRTLVTAAGRGYVLYPWVGGRGRGGLELTFAQCEALGELLGRLHAALDELTPPVQQSMLVPAPRAARAAAAVEAMLREVPDGGDGTDFDALTARRLRERRGLLTEFAGHQPPDIEVSTVGHLHGSFHAEHLRYGGSGNVTAVLGWGGLTTGPVAGEVVRSAARLFACEDERGLDLDRVQAFVRGHRSAFPLDAGQIQSAVHREWWERLCDVAPLRHRYLGEDGAGERVPAALVSWWSAHLDRTLDAFAVPYTAVYADAPGDSPAYG